MMIHSTRTTTTPRTIQPVVDISQPPKDVAKHKLAHNGAFLKARCGMVQDRCGRPNRKAARAFSLDCVRCRESHLTMLKRTDLPISADLVETDIPARLDRLPWGRFHTLVVVALGITWILDGLEVTLPA